MGLTDLLLRGFRIDWEEIGGGPLQPRRWAAAEFSSKIARESFLALAQSQFRGRGLYLLDEPEAALSPQRQLTLLLEIVQSVKAGGQFVIVTHSPILLGVPDAEILSFDDGPVHPVAYEETDSYQVTKLFLENREQMLARLLE